MMKTKFRRRSLFLLLLSCVALVREPAARACTEKSCESGLYVVLNGPAYMGSASYKMEITTDLGTTTCSTTFPLPPVPRTRPIVECSSPDVRVNVVENSGQTPRIESINFTRAYPRWIRLQVLRDGQPYLKTAETEIGPYREARPNGPGCLPVCKQASLYFSPFELKGSTVSPWR